MSSARLARDAPPVSTAIMSRYQTLRRLLIKIAYTSPFPTELFLSSAPPALTLPILSHLFLSYSPSLTQHFLQSGFLLSSGSFSLSALYALLHAVFRYHPQLSQQQFSSERGYVERKLQLLCDVLQMAVHKAEEIEREKGIRGGDGGSVSKGGVPRVAVIVNQQRRSGGEQQSEKSVQRQQTAQVAKPQRRAKREEQKTEQREEDQDDDSHSPQRSQQQHVSFTHDDSSQPLSPSRLSPLSNSQPSPRRSAHRSHSASSSQPLSSSSVAGADPLVTLHQQLHRISHRTNQLAHTHPPDSQAVSVERLAERVRAVETSVQGELSELRREMQDMRQRLAVVEQRERDREQREEAAKQASTKVEEAKEAEASSSGSDVQRMTKDGSGGGSATALPSDMSEFLTHMNDRLSSTAKLLESSRRARGRGSTGD